MGITYGGFAPSHGQTLGTVEFAMTNFPMEILKLDWEGIAREAIEVTNMNVEPTTAAAGFGNKMYVPSAYVEPGSLKLQVNHNPTLMIPIADQSKAGPEAITIKLGPSLSVQETYDVVGFLVKYELDGPLDGKALTATATIKLTDVVGGPDMYDATGAVTVTLAS